MNSKKEVPIKSFDSKWHEFLILYAVLSIVCCVIIFGTLKNIQISFESCFVKGMYVDGSDFSVLCNVFTMPIFALLALVNVGLAVLLEFCLVQVFKAVFFKSMVEDSEKYTLYKYINLVLLSSILFVLAVAALTLGTKGAVYYFIVYFPVPLFVFCSLRSNNMQHRKRNNGKDNYVK
ncbi:hypothetical protein [Inconstantimicrobium mannanitabidum]|uniref:Uncharacterized protein n=1 Tax=Inconstantimicrobium mannanitabidum TaxID=1604901 RepID=A0ACB5RA76_9CLOT|nr:hypothetical protein [Clostridium sp. TW13]GKX65942.1 hypothetical protein rsdtw13_12000 [Clostridium sp. TW13]